MRREIVAVVVGGLVLGGVTAAPAFAAEHGADKINGSVKAQPAAHAKAKTRHARRTVVYHGYEFGVPASWAVYRLDEHPRDCLRYDINAVYLGTAGANMDCPDSAIGRTQTITVLPGAAAAAGSGDEITYLRDQPDGVGGTRVGSLAAVRAAIIENAGEHELRVAIGVGLLGVTVLGTYGTDPAVTKQVLDTLRPAPKGAAATAQSGSSSALSAPSGIPASVVPQRAAAEQSASSPPTSTSWTGLHGWPRRIVVKPVPFAPVKGFDTCSAPSLDAMRAWRRDYSTVGIYIGGVNRGCGYGNLSASWVKSATARWGILPVYVGLQASCTSTTGNVVKIDQRRAAAEGSADGRYAVANARDFGLRVGSPIYDDMEAYNTGDPGCDAAVMTFLGAWDRAVSGAGYRTGVYSSRDSGVNDLEEATLAKRPGFTAPDAIWDAHWDGVASLSDGLRAWLLSDRIKQYAGSVNQSIGGFSLNIDRDLVGGLIAR
jgi:hypothetical protein